jgi:hypothetical protein
VVQEKVMAISNNSTGLRPGVCTSTTRPTAPYEGQMVYETDTDLMLIYNGSSWFNAHSVVLLNPETASYSIVITDIGQIVEMNVGTANNLTVPADNTVNFPIGASIDILQVGAGQTTIVATAGVTINRSTGLKLRAQWSAATLIKRAANTWVAIGDLSA